MGNLVFQATLGGQVNLVGPNTASTFNLNVPAVSATLATTDANTFTAAQTFAAGSASAPALTTTGDTNTGIFFPAADTVGITTGGTERLRVDSAGNGGLGVTPSAWSANRLALQIGGSSGGYVTANSGLAISSNYYYSSGDKFVANGYAPLYYLSSGNGQHQWYTSNNNASGAGAAVTLTQAMTLDASGNLGIGTSSPAANHRVDAYQASNDTYIRARTSGTTAGFISENASNKYFAGVYYSVANAYQIYDITNGAARMTIDSSGNLLVGTTSAGAGIGWTTRFALDAGGNYGAVFKTSSTSLECIDCWNAATTGNNAFVNFYTEASPTGRGSITYNRGGGLVAYNTTSDYRAKTVTGPVQNALSKLTSLKPSTGRMNGAEFDIDFFVAHELQEVVPSAVTGEKDAVKEDGTPIYQMVDKSALIPLLTAAIQEQQALITALTARITALEQA
jgi:hypothetical protein